MKPELLSPAGSVEKLETAYRFGADAAYMGVQSFSLRSRTESADPSLADRIAEIKGNRRLYGALNIFFHDDDLDRLNEAFEALDTLSFDALIVGPDRILMAWPESPGVRNSRLLSRVVPLPPAM